MGSHKTKIDDQLDHFGYADAKKEHGPLKFQITVRTYLLRCHLHNIQYSNPNNKISRYDKSQMWSWPLLNSQIPSGGHESAAHEPTGCFWAAVPQLSIVTLSAHNLASALPLLTSVWKNLEIWISAFLKVSRSHLVSQFRLYDFMWLLTIPGLFRFAGRS